MKKNQAPRNKVFNFELMYASLQKLNMTKNVAVMNTLSDKIIIDS